MSGFASQSPAQKAWDKKVKEDWDRRGAVFHSRHISRDEAEELFPQQPVAMIPGEPQRQQQVARLREKLEPRRKVAKALEQSSMRVPVYFHELAVASRLALFGYDDGLAQAMSRHNEHLVKCGVKGDFETAQ